MMGALTPAYREFVSDHRNGSLGGGRRQRARGQGSGDRRVVIGTGLSRGVRGQAPRLAKRRRHKKLGLL